MPSVPATRRHAWNIGNIGRRAEKHNLAEQQHTSLSMCEIRGVREGAAVPLDVSGSVSGRNPRGLTKKSSPRHFGARSRPAERLHV